MCSKKAVKPQICRVFMGMKLYCCLVTMLHTLRRMLRLSFIIHGSDGTEALAMIRNTNRWRNQVRYELGDISCQGPE
jgi:hypothetical protein